MDNMISMGIALLLIDSEDKVNRAFGVIFGILTSIKIICELWEKYG